MATPENTPAVKPITMSDIDAARYLGVSASFLRKARMEGDRHNYTPGPAFVKFGRAVRYTLDDLNAWIAANRHAKGAA